MPGTVLGRNRAVVPCDNKRLFNLEAVVMVPQFGVRILVPSIFHTCACLGSERSFS